MNEVNAYTANLLKAKLLYLSLSLVLYATGCASHGQREVTEGSDDEGAGIFTLGFV